MNYSPEKEYIKPFPLSTNQETFSWPKNPLPADKYDFIK
jgi:hypothetical protein